MGSNDFHGATLQVGLAGLCPINISICVSQTPLNVRVGVPAAVQEECADGPGRSAAL